MPKILFASNNIAHFPNSVAGSVVGTYAANRVPYAISLSNYEQVHSPVFPAAAGKETWFHFRTYFDSYNQYRSDRMFAAYDAKGNLLFQLHKKYNSSYNGPEVVLYDGATSTTLSSNLPLTYKKTNSVDIRYYQDDLNIIVELYINGSLGRKVSFSANPNGYGNPVRFSIGCGYTNDLEDRQCFSELIVADGDTRNARLDLLRPTAAGVYDNWNGNLNALADDDTTTGMTTITPGERQSVVLSAYGGASNISNVVTVSLTTRGQNSPTGIKHSIRMSGVDYDSANIPVSFPLQYNITDWQINPATSLPWEGSELAAIETGFVSVA
jgi:hypothetical protein